MKSIKIANVYFVPFYRSLLKKRAARYKHVLSSKEEILECQSLIWRTVAEHYIENDGGVYINNIGYLCHIICPVRKLSICKITNDINRKHTDGYKYTHDCMDFLPKNKYFHLVVQKSLRKKCHDLMNKGKRYKFLYREVQSEMEVFGRNWVHKF